MKRLLLLLLLAASLVFVSCPGPESPASPSPEGPSSGAGGDGRPPVPGKQVWTPFHNYDEFLSFYRGCWKRVDDDYYRWYSDSKVKNGYLSQGLLYEKDVCEPVVTNLSFAGAQALPEGTRGEACYAVSRAADFPYGDVFDDEKDVDIGLCSTDGSDYYFTMFTDARPYEGTDSLDGHCYYFSRDWYIKVSNDPDYDPSSGSGSGGGSGSLDAYIGEYSYSGTYNGSITVSDGSWSYNTSKAGAENAVVAGNAEMSGSNVKLYYTMPGVQGTLSEVFTVTINGSGATWRCIESNGYTATTSVIFSGLFGETDTQLTFSYEG